MKTIVIAGLTAAAMGIAAYINARRYTYTPKALGDKVYKVHRQEMTIPRDNHIIYGELLLPQDIHGKLPTVIVSHGLGSSGANAEKLVGMSLALSGFAVYCFDFYGGNRHSKSGGRMDEMTVFTEKDDLNAVITYIKTLETTDTDKLFLLGESQGGFVTAVTAAEHPEIRGVVLYYPALCIPEDARKRHSLKENIPEQERFGPNLLGRAYSESVWDYDVYNVIAAYKEPVLILHGDNDRVVNDSYGRRAADVYEHAEFICLPGEIHGFTGKGRKKAAQLSYEFLMKTLSGDDQKDHEKER